ncbi:MAG: hypothetical protein HZB25_09415 [Candidatus Eisenbacteria bacterium]|nr:hypothetical protein [Candidatus Eisenbacteria bacterium]
MKSNHPVVSARGLRARMSLCALVAVLAWAAFAMPAAAQVTGPAPGDTGIIGPPAPPPPPLPYVLGIYMDPPQPCAGRPTRLVLLGEFPDQCGRVVSASPPGAMPLTVTVSVAPFGDSAGCATMMKSWRQGFDLPTMNAGTFTVKLVEVVLDGPRQGTYETMHTFFVSPACDSTIPPPPVPTPGPLPFVENVRIGWPSPVDPTVPTVCPGDSFPVYVDGHFNDGCWSLERIELQTVLCFAAPCLPIVRVIVRRDQGGACPLWLKPFAGQVFFPGLPPGRYQLPMQLVMRFPSAAGVVESVFTAGFAFAVSKSCDSTVVPTPPPSGPLPYVDQVVIGPEFTDYMNAGCVAAGDSIPVLIRGTFPHSCISLRRVDVIPSASMGPLPWPPTLRIVINDGDCTRVPCLMQARPWEARVMLPALPALRYSLEVVEQQLRCGDPDNLPPQYRATFPFQVSNDCPGSKCLTGGWVHTSSNVLCDAHAAPGRTVEAGFTARSPVALAGLQGTLMLYPPGMFVQKIEAVGPASGMHLSWNRTAEGVKFVMYAEHGALIPATRTGQAAPEILRVTLYPDTDLVGVASNTKRMFLTAGQLLGADSIGGGVTECMPPPYERLDMYYNAFTICLDDPCDLNTDGASDVRDLVLMVRCINGEGTCPDSAVARAGCSHSATLTIDDVVCCATGMLLDTGGGCPECVPDSGWRSEPDVKLSFDTPVKSSTGAELTMHLAGGSRVGAAKLEVSYPSDRYDVASMDFPGDAANWLHLYQVKDGKVRIALITAGALAKARAAAGGPLDMVLRLTLKPGASHGGQLAVAGSQFSGPDGVPLTVSLGTEPQWIVAPPRLSLSTNRPNPFSTATRFSLELDQDSDVDVGVFDVTGRRVATLFRGRLAAGSHPFGWDARVSEGAYASNGIYFARATSLGRVISRKMLLVRGS